MASTDRLVWIDCEFTGLDTTRDALVEVACIVTDGELNPLGEGVSVVIAPPAEAVEGMDNFVRDMHTTSGLIHDWDSGLDMTTAQATVLAYVKEHTPEGKAPLAGNTVGMDKVFLQRDMPELMAWLHYRVVDVSSIKELVRRWYPRVFFASPEKHGGHRALGDIRDSIQELRYYRTTIFAPLPGPSSDEAKAAATHITENDSSAVT